MGKISRSTTPAPLRAFFFVLGILGVGAAAMLAWYVFAVRPSPDPSHGSWYQLYVQSGTTGDQVETGGPVFEYFDANTVAVTAWLSLPILPLTTFAVAAVAVARSQPAATQLVNIAGMLLAGAVAGFFGVLIVGRGMYAEYGVIYAVIPHVIMFVPLLGLVPLLLYRMYQRKASLGLAGLLVVAASCIAGVVLLGGTANR